MKIKALAILILGIMVLPCFSYAHDTKSEAYLDDNGRVRYIQGLQTNLTATTDPAATDDITEGYRVGSIWVNTTSDTIYFCVDNTEDAAVWSSGGSSSVETDTNCATYTDLGQICLDTDDEQLYVGLGATVLLVSSGSGDMTVAVYDANDDGTVDAADIATALAANGGNCSAGNSPLGVDASGAVESCFDVWTETENTAAGYIANVSEDTTPTAGGEFDFNGNNIVGLADVTFQTGATGGTLRTGTSAADKFQLQAYDVNGGSYTKVMEADANNEPTLEVFDETFQIRDSADETKIVIFELGGITASNTRTITVPDDSGTIVYTSQVPSLETDPVVGAVNGVVESDGGGNISAIVNLAGLNTALGSNIADGAHTADTNANTLCSGSTTYLDGDGNCDDISNTYLSKSALATYPISCSDGDVLGTNCGAGVDYTLTQIVQIASGTVELMAVSAGYKICVKATTAAAIHVDANASDRFKLDGTALDDGDKLSSDGTIDSTICFYADSADGWTTIGNQDGFTDGGA